MEKSVIIALIIGLVVGLVIGLGISTLTGNVAVERVCTDDDGGRNIEVKGTTYDNKGVSQTDYCVLRTTLKEFYCTGNLIESEQILCDGDCVEGRCVN